MKTSIQTLIRTLATVSLLSAAGCATTAINEDKEAQARSQKYLESLSLVPSTNGRLSTSANCVVPTETERLEWKTLVARANRCMVDRNWASLEKTAEAIARGDVSSPWGAYFFSVAAENRGDYPRALWMADLAQKKAGGKTGLFYFQKGRILLGMKETKKGIAEIEKAIGLDPRLGEGHLFLAEIYLRDLEFNRAEAHFKTALDLDPKSYRALTGLAETKLEKNSGTEAAELYAKAVSAHPGQLRPLVRLAYVYETITKNAPEALATYKTLKSKLESGAVIESPEIDLTMKIKTLEAAVQAASPSRLPAAQTTAKGTEEKRSTK